MKLIKMRIYISIVLFFIVIAVKAQSKLMNYSVWSQFKPERVGDLYLRVENSNFFDNYEYSSPHTIGQTLIGAWARIMSEYYFNEQLKIQVGVNGLKYTGRKSFSNISEWFSVEYHPFSKLRLLLGNIDYYSSLGLPSPLYNPALFSIKPINRGLQIELFDRFIDAKTWLDWEQFIVEGDAFQEIFTAGLSSEIKVFDSTSSWRLSFPVHILGRHQGGEIDDVSNGVESLMNYSFGSKTSFFVGRINVETVVSYLIFNDITESYRQRFIQGSALFAYTMASYKGLRLGGQFWISKNFYAPHGHPIYQSYTPLKPYRAFARQKLISLQSDFSINIGKAAKLFIEGNMWYDFPNKATNFATGLKLIITEDFFMRELKKQSF